MMRPAPAGKVLLRKVNEVLTAGVGWIAWSDCDQPGSLKRVKIAAAGEGRACRRPAARSARRTDGPSMTNTLASPRPGYPTRGDWAAHRAAQSRSYVTSMASLGSSADQAGRGRHVGFVLHLALKKFLGYGRAFLPARGLIVRNAHIGKPRVSRGVFLSPVAFGMFITIHRALNLLTRPDEIPALGAGAGGLD
jgi:hypothetical protein